jgi:cytochrome P450
MPTPIPGPDNLTKDSVIEGLRTAPAAFTTELVETYGDVVHLPFGDRDLFLISHPDYIEQIFHGGDAFAKRKDVEAETSYIGQISGFAALLSGKKVADYAPMMTEAADRAHQRWQQLAPGPVDIYREMMRITLDVETRTIFQVDVESLDEDVPALLDALVKMEHSYGFNPIEALLGEFMPPLTPSAEELAAKATMLAFIERVIAAFKANPQADTLLAMLLQYMPPEAVAPQALTVFTAMHEVTATTLPWAWYLLSQAPEAAAKLQAELASVLGGRAATYDDVKALPYTQQVLMEARRLYPSVWLVGRFLRQAVQFGDYTLPENGVVMPSQWVMHHHSRYFPDPDRFDPERWTADAIAARPAFAYFPFSAGPRQCAGENFAEVQDVLILATLAQHWQAELVPGQTLEPVQQRSDAPRYGIQVTLHPR